MEHSADLRRQQILRDLRRRVAKAHGGDLAARPKARSAHCTVEQNAFLAALQVAADKVIAAEDAQEAADEAVLIAAVAFGIWQSCEGG